MSERPPARRRRRAAVASAAVVALVAVAFGLNGVEGDKATADTSPPPGMPATYGATPLPTVQVNGIVWAQAVVGNTVYVTGNFTDSRPAGAAPNTNLTPAGNILAYDITTGERIMSFNHTLDGPGRSMAVSPDGQRLYVGGDFINVNGVRHVKIVAFNTSTGAVDETFNGKAGSTVLGIVPTADTVYVGGSFVSAGTTPGPDIPRSNLAAFAASTGALLPWAPTATGGIVKSLLMAPGGGKLVAAGQFSALNGTQAYGMGALDPASGATLPWLANQKIQNRGASAISGLSTDGALVYGVGESWNGSSNFEGRFALNPADGSIVWANDCHGDSYATLPVNGVLYSTGHVHDCSWVGSFPDYFPAGEKWHHLLAETTFATGVNVGPDNYGWNYSGVPSSTILPFFPSLTAATSTKNGMPAGTVAVSGYSQTAWSLAANASGTYMAVGGEFPSAGFKPQQGLTRFAVPALTQPSGPVYANVPTPTVTPQAAAGTARVTWGSAWDRDNENLTYEIYRDNGATPLTKQTMPSSFWRLDGFGSLLDTGLTAGSHTYTLKVTDPDGNWVKKSTTVVIAQTGFAPAASTNLALNKPTSSSSLESTNADSSRAVDGNTSTADGSTMITKSTAQSWWQVDLTQNATVAEVKLFGRSGNNASHSADYWVFVSKDPIDLRLTNQQIAAQSGVWSSYQAAAANPSATLALPANTTGRYVTVRHGGTARLGFAEVQVSGQPPAPPVVDTMPPTVPTGVTVAQAGTTVNVNWEASTDLPDPGGVGVSGYYVIRDYTTQWLVPGTTLTFADTTATPGLHRYQVRAVDKGSRLSAATAVTTITVTDPNVVVDTLPPTVPTGVTATQNGVNVDVAWQASTDLPDPGGVGVSGYYVIRDYTTQWLVPATQLTFTDTGATPGLHRYQVRAVDKGSRLSAATAVTTITVTDPNVVVIVDNEAPTVPTGLTVAQNGANVDVAWQASTDLPDPGGVGIGGYYVIRDYTTKWLVAPGTTTFTDTSATPGLHRYQIRAIDKGNRMSAATAVATITVA